MKDGHVHTAFCPHGTKDSLEKYIEQALSLGYKEITFTEHAPLPDGFLDTTPTQDSAIKLETLESYFAEIERIKQKYKKAIKVNTGLEIDFIEGYEETIKEFMNKIGHRLDDSILSVHFLKYGNDYDCIDYSPGLFANIAEKYGSVTKVYQKYFQTLLLSIQSDLGPYKPKRIGHITLVRKFQKKFPASSEFRTEIKNVLKAMSDEGCELDYNGAGTAKPLCREPYPPGWVVEEARNMGIAVVYGSDAHQAIELGQGRTNMLL